MQSCTSAQICRLLCSISCWFDPYEDQSQLLQNACLYFLGHGLCRVSVYYRYAVISVQKHKSDLILGLFLTEMDGQMDGWMWLFIVAGFSVASCIWFHVVCVCCTCHIWTVVLKSNRMMNRAGGEQRKARCWISLLQSGPCSNRQGINICRHSPAIHSIHVRMNKQSSLQCNLPPPHCTTNSHRQKYVCFVLPCPLCLPPPKTLWAWAKRTGKG